MLEIIDILRMLHAIAATYLFSLGKTEHQLQKSESVG